MLTTIPEHEACPRVVDTPCVIRLEKTEKLIFSLPAGINDSLSLSCTIVARLSFIHLFSLKYNKIKYYKIKINTSKLDKTNPQREKSLREVTCQRLTHSHTQESHTNETEGCNVYTGPGADPCRPRACRSSLCPSIRALLVSISRVVLSWCPLFPLLLEFFCPLFSRGGIGWRHSI